MKSKADPDFYRKSKVNPDFYKRMSYVCERIPYGKVATYGQIALLCGFPKNARQVGYALRKDLCGENTPAQRIVNAGGILSGAAAFAAPDTQRKLLAAEGVTVIETEKGSKVDLKKYGWQPTMDEAEELYAIFQQEGI